MLQILSLRGTAQIAFVMSFDTLLLPLYFHRSWSLMYVIYGFHVGSNVVVASRTMTLILLMALIFSILCHLGSELIMKREIRSWSNFGIKSS